MDEKSVARFWSKVDKSAGPDACWVWTASKVHGYGQFSVGGGRWRMRLAHRVAWELTNGPIPASEDRYGTMCVCHRCDARHCVNPSHLFLGMHADNMSDMNAKGRGVVPCRELHAKLTTDLVAALRADRGAGMSYPKLGAKYGVSHVQARRVALGMSWSR